MENEELYIPDCLFPTDNELEIPCLLSDVQPKYIEIPFYCFGEQARTTNMNGSGTLHFYTDDYIDSDQSIIISKRYCSTTLAVSSSRTLVYRMTLQ